MAGPVSPWQEPAGTPHRSRAGAGPLNLAEKHALITGGTRGIGLATAELLAQHGARVSVISRSAQSAKLFFSARADITDEDQIARAFSAAREANGPIGILVNNAGIAESAAVARTDRGMWDRIIATNLTGTFLCTREALPDMRKVNWGRIVSVASTAGLTGAPYIAAYCASKHGVVGFTRAIAAEVADSGITANAICPGYTESDMLQRTVANITSKTGRSEEATLALLAQSNPEGRIATAEEVAEGILELISSSRNGTTLVIPHA